MSISESGQYDLLDQLAEEFAARFRRGERPALKEYIDRYPDLADEIRDLFPAMIKVEQAEGERQGEEAGPAWNPRAASPPPRQIGDYRILREIGRGGMGVVYEAEQISLGRRVRAEGPAAGGLPRPGGPGAVPPRGSRRGPIAPYQHRAGLRGRAGRGCPLLRHAAHPGSGPGHGHHRVAAAPRAGSTRFQEQGGLRGPVAPAPRRAIPPWYRRPDTRRRDRGRGQRGVAVHLDRSVRAWRPGPRAGGSLTIAAGQGPRRRPRDTDRDRDGESCGRIRPRTDEHQG